jgi:hypothetical protein
MQNQVGNPTEKPSETSLFFGVVSDAAASQADSLYQNTQKKGQESSKIT